MEWECFEWIWEKITSHLNPRWQSLNPRWQNSIWLPSSSSVRMNEWSYFFVQNSWFHNGRIQDGCHHQVEWNEWMKFFLYKMAESRMADFNIAAIINLSENAWVKFFCSNGWIQDGRVQDGCHHQVQSEWMMEVFFVKIVGTNLGKCEWVWEEKLRWLNSRWQSSRWLSSST